MNFGWYHYLGIDHEHRVTAAIDTRSPSTNRGVEGGSNDRQSPVITCTSRLMRQTSHQVRAKSHRRGIVLLAFGLAFISLSIPAILWLLHSDLAQIDGTIGPIPVIDPSFAQVDSLPMSTDAEVFEDWVIGMITNILLAGVMIAFYGTIVVLFFGFAFVSFGIVFLQREQIRAYVDSLGPTARLALGTATVSLLGYVVYLLIVSDPATRRAVVELSIAAGIGGSLLSLFGGLWMSVRNRMDHRFSGVLLYPLGSCAVLVPVIVAGLISPTFSDGAQQLSSVIAIAILDSVLEIGDVNEFLRATFDLDGVNYVLFWTSMAAILGWIVGFTVEGVNYLRRR